MRVGVGKDLEFFYNLWKDGKIDVFSEYGSILIETFKERRKVWYQSNETGKYISVNYYLGRQNNKQILWTTRLHKIIWVSTNGLYDSRKYNISFKDSCKSHCWISNLELLTDSERMKKTWNRKKEQENFIQV